MHVDGELSVRPRRPQQIDLADLAVRRDRLRALSVQASRRQRELIEMTARARQRREQMRADRDRIRAQMALRFQAVTADRRAASAILEAAWKVTGIPLEDLWVDYFALGGYASLSRVGQMLAGDVPLTRSEHDRLAVALNERLAQEGWGSPLSYWDGTR